jgi:diguanylate cyclase (GGDEF)-like protein
MMAAEQPLLADVLRIAGRLTPRQIDRVTGFCDDIIAGSAAAEQDSWLRLSFGRQSRAALKMAALGGDRWLLGIEDLIPAEQTVPSGGEAMLDALTGLHNRRHFNQAMAETLAEAAPPGPAVLLVDLDGFSGVNQAFGQPAGDSLLCLVARRLRRETRDDDAIARLGGDKFAILQPNGHRAESVAARMVDILSQPFLVEGHIVTISASIGIARSAGDPPAPDALMRQAELALYDAKRGGRRTWRIFDPATADQARSRRELENNLRRALALGELSVEFQPRRDILTRRLTGFEAVPRWHHAVHGPVPAAVFLPAAEAIGCGSALGKWLLTAACQQAQRHFGGLPVTVNLPPGQFADADSLCDAIQGALAASGLPPDRLAIAITEAALTRTGSTLPHRLRSLGPRLELDDFGSDQASLRQALACPFDTITISRPLTAALGHDRTAGAVVGAIAALASGLGIAVLARGVDTAEQAARLAASGCTMIQGGLAGGAGDLLAQVRQDGEP